MKKTLTLISMLIISTLTINAQSIAYPCDDMTTNAGNSSMFPSNTQLWIANWSAMQNYHQTLIKFDLSNFTNESLESATLNLYQFFHAPDGSPTPCSVYAINEEWDEGSWPTNTNISHYEEVYGSTTFTSEIGWYQIDISQLVDKWMENDITNNGLVIIAENGTKFAKMYSKEADDQTKRPYLELNFNTATNEVASAKNVSIYPNPATNYFNVSIQLEKSQMVSIDLFDVLGNKVKAIANEYMTAGEIAKKVDCNDMPKGLYFVRISADAKHIAKKVIIK